MAKKSHRLKWALNIVTLILIGVVVYFAWPDISCLWQANPELCEQPLLVGVNYWILILIIPVQFLSYLSNDMMIYTYLRGRGQLKHTPMSQVVAMSLELNFVNHIFPSGGLSGATYMVWRLGKLGVSAGQATMSQIIRFLLTMAVFIVFLAISLFVVTAGNATDNWIVLMSAIVVTTVFFIVVFAAYLVGSRNRITSFAKWITRSGNKIVRIASFGYVKKKVLIEAGVVKFFLDIHEDFEVVKAEKRLLIKPLIWGLIFMITDVGLFAITFLAMGVAFNPAVLILGYIVAFVAGSVMITPGGVGGFELAMIAVLVSGGMIASEATAGVILARVILVILTLASGYVVYHRALRHFGRPAMDAKIELAPEHIEKAKK
ncbi:membrane protein [Alphaproteobacteria bacterium]|nr:membrane protein [Alphaproteobacteria bacterium]